MSVARYETIHFCCYTARLCWKFQTNLTCKLDEEILRDVSFEEIFYIATITWVCFVYVVCDNQSKVTTSPITWDFNPMIGHNIFYTFPDGANRSRVFSASTVLEVSAANWVQTKWKYHKLIHRCDKQQLSERKIQMHSRINAKNVAPWIMWHIYIHIYI